MGQYYRPTILGKSTHRAKKIIVKQAFTSYDYDNGAKLMEHSYVGNYLVKVVENALYHYYDGHPFVWAGDYADEKYGCIVYERAHEFVEKSRKKYAKDNGYKKKKGPSWGNNWVKNGNYYSDKDVIDKTPYEELENNTYEFIINYDKKQFIRIPKESNEKDKYGYPKLTIHPLPLLCADGNGRGGGDYNGKNMSLVGAWAYDRIGIDNEIPTGITTELVADFEEYVDNVDDFTYVEHK